MGKNTQDMCEVSVKGVETNPLCGQAHSIQRGESDVTDAEFRQDRLRRAIHVMFALVCASVLVMLLAGDEPGSRQHVRNPSNFDDAVFLSECLHPMGGGLVRHYASLGFRDGLLLMPRAPPMQMGPSCKCR